MCGLSVCHSEAYGKNSLFFQNGILTNVILLSPRLFVNIGKGLISGGPASLFIAYTLWQVFNFIFFFVFFSTSFHSSIEGQEYCNADELPWDFFRFLGVQWSTRLHCACQKWQLFFPSHLRLCDLPVGSSILRLELRRVIIFSCFRRHFVS